MAHPSLPCLFFFAPCLSMVGGCSTDADGDGITGAEEEAVGCAPWYYDEDADGYGLSSSSLCLSGAQGL